MSSRSARAMRNVLARSLGPVPPARAITRRSPSATLRHLSASSVPLRRAQSALPAFAPRHADQSFPPPIATPVTGTSSSADDSNLRAHFDQPLSPPSSSYASSSHPGLFLFPPLTDPSSLGRLTERTLIHGHAIVQRIRNAPLDPTGRELRLVVKNLDRLSDLLCGVVDMCELVRNVHPEQEWVQAADMAYERLCGLMNELNTDQGLYKSLVATLQHEHTAPLSEAETQVALTFLRDFEKSGIHLPPDLRQRVVELSDSILSLGRTFLTYASSGPSPTPLIELPDADTLLAGLGSQFITSLPRGRLGKRGSRYVTPGSWEAQMIARYAREGEARRLVYIGGVRRDEERVEVLERMLRERAELAAVLGKESWAEVVLVDKMAKTPGNVMGFLSSLADQHRPAAAADVATLQRLKAHGITGREVSSKISPAALPPLHAWDRDYYSERHLMSTTPSSSLPPISPYFSTGSAMLGLSRLFSRLYGISFRVAEMEPGEGFHPSVRRLDVVDEEEGLIGVIYCDLFSREGKPAGAAHYTVRCSRRVDDDDLAGDKLQPEWDEAYGPGLEVEGDEIRGREGRYQLPVVVLTTDFGKVEEGRPALLAWSDLETLFHEMGHALHSMIGRTDYHNVSGTRCATDFVELPSILMEHFVSSPDVLALFATHYATDEPLPLPLLQAHLAQQRSLAALETHGQILMAILDQSYHSLSASSLPTFDSTATHQALQRSIGVIPPVENTAWQTQFGHLYGYGATYYSYLFDRAIANKMWHTLFRDPEDGGSLSREGGEVLKQKVLKWGGGRDPWVMVGDLIGGAEGEVVRKGDEESMRVVGKWELK